MRTTISLTAIMALCIAFISCSTSETEKPKNTANQFFLSDKQKELLETDSLLDVLFADTSDFFDTSSIGRSQLFPMMAPPVKKQYFGSPVKYSDIEPCLALYKKTMEKHGIDIYDPRQIDRMVPTSLKITLKEIFRGRELMQFLRAAARKHSILGISKKKLAIRIEFGIYTKKFVQDRDRSREGRIGIFFVTHEFTLDNNTKLWLEESNPDAMAFDFGGIHP